MFTHTTRRHFLQSTAAAFATMIFPRSLFAREPDDSFFFIHADSCTSWAVADPVQWSLEHAQEPILERASEGLLKLTVADSKRIVRLVVRRCPLNLLELHPGRVVVHHWSQHRVDLRAFFKSHGLARREIEVVLRDRKKEVATIQTGDDFFFGDRLNADFPLELFQSKWEKRFSQEGDDWIAAPGTWSGFAWEGIESNLIPWAALKSAWRRSAGSPCMNCDGPTILTNFGNPWSGMFHRSPRFIPVCGKCRRSFRDDSIKDVGEWIEGNLDEGVRPSHKMIWERRIIV
jgi:hypothetical protein